MFRYDDGRSMTDHSFSGDVSTEPAAADAKRAGPPDVRVPSADLFLGDPDHPESSDSPGYSDYLGHSGPFDSPGHAGRPDHLEYPAYLDPGPIGQADPVDFVAFESRSSSAERSSHRLKRMALMLVVFASAALVAITVPSRPDVVESTAAPDGGAEPAAPSLVDREDESGQPATEASRRVLNAAVGGGAARNRSRSMGDEADRDEADRDEADDAEATTTSVRRPTTTVSRLVDPPVEPESEWKDAGHGVRIPDVLFRIRFCESTNNYKAAHTYSTASGAYQFLTGSWKAYGHAGRYGTTRAAAATNAQQDEAALLTWRKDGTRPWLASRHCWANPAIRSNYATARPRVNTTTTAPSTTAETATTVPTTVPSTETTAPTTASSTTAPPTTATTVPAGESSTTTAPSSSTTIGSTSSAPSTTSSSSSSPPSS